METIQLAIADAAYRAALRELLERSGVAEVCAVEMPDPGREGVIVVDSLALERLPLPLVRPERVVLITRNEPDQLSRAWNAGIRSVVFCDDPLNTAVLAILAAGLRRFDKGSEKLQAESCCRRPPGKPGSGGSAALERDGHRPKDHEDRG